MVRAATDPGHTADPYVMGWEVCVPPLKTDGKPRPISGRFTVKASAEQFCELSRRGGTPECFVREIMGLEGPK